MREILLIIAMAVIIDWVAGDPPNAFHPVAWMGSFINILKVGGLERGRKYQLVYGFLAAISGGCFIFILSLWFLNYLRSISLALYIVVGFLLFKSSFTFSGLRKAAMQVAESLRMGNIQEARQLVSRHLASREVDELDAPAIASATVESVAENFTDVLVAPMFYFLLGGVPGALTFRFINTADAMIGYHDPVHEYLGKGAARLDDLLVYIPARVAGLLLVGAAWLRRENSGGAWRTMWRKHSLTASPNAGWTMSAVAGALGIVLEKKGHYRLGEGDELPCAEHISRALELVKAAYVLTIIIVVAVILGVGYGR